MVIKKFLMISLWCMSVYSVDSFSTSSEMAKICLNNLPDEIVTALKNGDAKGISKFFNSSVELIFSESQGVYGKAQAEQILRTFFTNNAPASGTFNYKNLHSSDKDNAQYYIGELHTGKGLYRVYIYMKDQHIHQMRIENND